MRNKGNWDVGDWYFVIIDGVEVWGEITTIDKAGYHVSWNDFSCTIESFPDPAQAWLEHFKMHSEDK